MLNDRVCQWDATRQLTGTAKSVQGLVRANSRIFSFIWDTVPVSLCIKTKIVNDGKREMSHTLLRWY